MNIRAKRLANIDLNLPLKERTQTKTDFNDIDNYTEEKQQKANQELYYCTSHHQHSSSDETRPSNSQAS